MSASPTVEQGLADAVKARFGEKVVEVKSKPTRVKISVDRAILADVAYFIRDNLSFDHLVSVDGTDYPKDNVIELIYHVTSIEKQEQRKYILSLATKLPRDAPISPSLVSVWPAAEYHERETFEMLGIEFTGHPKLEKLLLPEDWLDIPPLRKDFKLPGR